MSTFAQIQINGESYIRANDKVNKFDQFVGNTADAKAVIAWLADLDEMDRTTVVNAAGAVSKSFYE